MMNKHYTFAVAIVLLVSVASVVCTGAEEVAAVKSNVVRVAAALETVEADVEQTEEEVTQEIQEEIEVATEVSE